MKTTAWAASFAAALFIVSNASSFGAEAKVEERVVGPVIGNPPRLITSPSGVSIATLAMKGSRSVVIVNGETGPELDELLNKYGNPSLSCVDSVLFSQDGKTHLYAGRVGDQFLIIRDGKEVYRAPYASRAFDGGTGQLTLTPMGKHFSLLEKVDMSASQHGWRLVIDGKPGPLSSNNNSFKLFFSRDESRWAYVANKLGSQSDQLMVVDGKETAYVGHHIRFTGDNKLVVAAPGSDGTFNLVVDGKVVAKSIASADRQIWVSPVGSGVAAAIRKAPGEYVLWVNGKEIADSSGAKDIVDVTFSPDGKHYIAACVTGAAQYAIVDGKKGREYRSISYPTFTANSSHALYVAGAGSQNFVIADGAESAGFEMIGGQYVHIALPKTGGRYAYTTGDGMNRIFSAVVDGVPVALNNKAPVADSLAFSADGSRYAFAAAQVGRSEIDTLFVDGKEVPDIYPQPIVQGAPNTARREVFFIFSPGGKHIANYAANRQTKARGLYVDNHLVYPTERSVSHVAFTPDGNHLVFATSVPGKNTPVPAAAWFVDGKQVLEVPGYPLDQTGIWEMTADGVYQFVTAADTNLKLFRLTPAEDSNVDLMITQAAAAQAKALADADAAKKKAEEDALAAKQKAEADKAAAAAKAKADYDAAVAKKKADREAAAAAKAKARQDAIDAKARARANK